MPKRKVTSKKTVQKGKRAKPRAKRETTPTLTEQEMAMKERIAMMQPIEIKKMLTKSKITFDKKATRPALVDTYMRHVAQTRKQGKTSPRIATLDAGKGTKKKTKKKEQKAIKEPPSSAKKGGNGRMSEDEGDEGEEDGEEGDEGDTSEDDEEDDDEMIAAEKAEWMKMFLEKKKKKSANKKKKKQEKKGGGKKKKDEDVQVKILSDLLDEMQELKAKQIKMEKDQENSKNGTSPTHDTNKNKPWLTTPECSDDTSRGIWESTHPYGREALFNDGCAPINCFLPLTEEQVMSLEMRSRQSKSISSDELGNLKIAIRVPAPQTIATEAQLRMAMERRRDLITAFYHKDGQARSLPKDHGTVEKLIKGRYQIKGICAWINRAFKKSGSCRAPLGQISADDLLTLQQHASQARPTGQPHQQIRQQPFQQRPRNDSKAQHDIYAARPRIRWQDRAKGRHQQMKQYDIVIRDKQLCARFNMGTCKENTSHTSPYGIPRKHHCAECSSPGHGLASCPKFE